MGYLFSSKFNYCLIAVFCTFINNTYADWIPLNAGINDNLLSISSYAPNGLIVGEKNIYITTTGGKTSADWAIYTPTGSNAALFAQSKIYSSATIYVTGVAYICGEDTINHNAVIFSIVFSNKSLTLEYTGPAGSQLNSIINTYTSVCAVGNNGLFVTKYTPQSEYTDYTYHTISTNTTQNLNQITFDNNSIYIAGDEVLISGTINSVSLTNICPNKNFISISFTDAYSFLMVATATDIYNVTSSLTYTRDSLYDAPGGLRPTFIGGGMIATQSGIYVGMGYTNTYEYQPSSNKGNFTYLGSDANTDTDFAIGKNGLILYTTTGGGITIPFAQMKISGGCVNSPITYYAYPGSGTSLIWYANGIYQSESATWFAEFSSPGPYKIELIVYNSLYTDTLYQTVYISNKPTINLKTSISDNILCKSEQTTISIANSQAGIEYQLRVFPMTSSSTFGIVSGNGGTANLLTNYINSTGNYFLSATEPQSTCFVYFTDTIPINVEHTKARFTSASINLNINTPDTIYDNSYQSAYARWTITNGTNVFTSTVNSPEVSFSLPGSTTVKLVATSIHNCSDSVKAAGPNIVQEPIDDGCWMLRYSPDTFKVAIGENLSNILDIQECSDGFLVSGQYFEQAFTSRAGSSYQSHPFGGAYLAKYSTAGVLKWISYSVDSIDNNLNYTTEGALNSIAIASNGNIYVTGSIGRGDYLFDATGDSLLFTSNSITESSLSYGIILCYSPNGRLLWYRDSNLIPEIIKTDNAGNVIVSGSYGGDELMFYSADSSGIITNLFFNDYYGDGKFILKLDASGNILWNTYLKYRLQPGYDITIDSQNNIIIVGASQGNVNISSSNNSLSKILHVVNINNVIGYTIKFSPDGFLVWGSLIEDAKNSLGQAFTSIAIINDSCYITGGAVDKGAFRITQPDSSFINIQTGPTYLLKLADNGFYQWVSSNCQTSNQTGLNFIRAQSSNDSLIVMGYLESQGNIDTIYSISGSKVPFAPNSSYVFINYDHAGNVLSYQNTGINPSGKNYIHENEDFFYSRTNNSIYFSGDILLSNTPYQFLNESFTSDYNFIIYKIANDFCSNTSVTTRVQNTVQSNANLTIYPNPLTGSSAIYMGKEGMIKTIHIMDVTGKVVATVQTDNSSYTITPLLSNNAAGVYIVQVTCNNETLTSRIIKID
jgi:hypothetical protein